MEGMNVGQGVSRKAQAEQRIQQIINDKKIWEDGTPIGSKIRERALQEMHELQTIVVQEEIAEKEKAKQVYKEHLAQEAIKDLEDYDGTRPSVEVAKIMRQKLLADKNGAYWNPEAPLELHQYAVAQVNALDEYIAGRRDTLRGWFTEAEEGKRKEADRMMDTWAVNPPKDLPLPDFNPDSIGYAGEKEVESRYGERPSAEG